MTTRLMKASPLVRIRLRASELPHEEKDKLLFEVFDMLLRNAKLPSTYPQPRLVADKKECRLRTKQGVTRSANK